MSRSVNDVQYAVQYHYKGDGPPGSAPSAQVSPGLPGGPESVIGPDSQGSEGPGPFPDPGAYGSPDQLGLADLSGRKPWNDYRQNEEKVRLDTLEQR